jgi:hypothetical protein
MLGNVGIGPRRHLRRIDQQQPPGRVNGRSDRRNRLTRARLFAHCTVTSARSCFDSARSSASIDTMPSGSTGNTIVSGPADRITASCSSAVMMRRAAMARLATIPSDSLAPLVNNVSPAQP